MEWKTNIPTKEHIYKQVKPQRSPLLTIFQLKSVERGRKEDKDQNSTFY